MVISIIAIIQSNRKSKLILKYNVYDSDSRDFYNKDGRGKIILYDSGNGYCITECRPGAELNLIIENKSKIVARNPIMNFKFNNIAVILNNNEDWSGISFNYGDGTWSEIRWSPKDGTKIHKGIPLVLDMFSFNNCPFFDKNGFIEVVLSADNMKTKKFNIPLEVVKL